MPQMIVEYSVNIQNLDRQALMQSLNQALFDTGLIGHPDEIKTRIRANEDFLIGFGDTHQAYIHVCLYILTGRTDEQKAKMADDLSKCLNAFKSYDASGLNVQLCVEISEMPRAFYRKTTQ
ncbi:5-carboxymethyl-2-hydroxymuconate Delta-isomerase [Acinetobacter sp. 194]|uniref:5-carboxymethyl-2-hydroxymuconate Delta-isomerase n=1 Tax=Acinetobacter shaoyimingii TaxID=2715164 RepID=UPI0014098F61|nr:5-carboxymethyl-2-hydroxymuconate Delta-isomerase [Acinetobacter shaoyimingii]NHB57302.1 5-carboxymethyl-2-hydroxymuconate Delta-isomerase [Acinetobacter shaoyimingii]